MPEINENIFEKAKRIAAQPPEWAEFKRKGIEFAKMQTFLSSGQLEQKEFKWDEVKAMTPFAIYSIAILEILDNASRPMNEDNYNWAKARTAPLKSLIDKSQAELMNGWTIKEEVMAEKKIKGLKGDKRFGRVTALMTAAIVTVVDDIEEIKALGQLQLAFVRDNDICLVPAILIERLQESMGRGAS